MSYVVDGVEEAFEKTRDLLLPFDLNTWLKLAIIVILTGGIGFNFPFLPGESISNIEDHQSYENPSTLDNSQRLTGAFASTMIVPVAISAAIGIGLIFLLISSIFEFVYYRSLLDEKVSIRDNFGRNTGKGSQYFILRVLLTILVLLIFGIGILSIIVTPLALIPLIIAFIPAAILLYAFNTFVHDFVLLEMLEEDKDLIGGFKSTSRKVREEWRNFGLYLLLKLVLSAIVGTGIFMGTALLGIILAIPLSILGVILAAVSPILAIPVILLGIIGLTGIILALSVPGKTYLYYYAISVYSELGS